MYEIERKFKVETPIEKILSTAQSINRLEIEQVYLPKTGKWSQRVRKVYNHNLHFTEYLFTMKKKVTNITCIEAEVEVNSDLFDLFCEYGTPVLKKVRYDILCRKDRWHVDVFLDPEFKGLIVAEIELKSESDTFGRPIWLGQEVTTKKRYKNFQMACKLAKLRGNSDAKR